MTYNDMRSEYGNKLNSGLDRLEDYIRGILHNNNLIGVQVTEINNLDKEFKLNIFKDIPLKIYYGVYYGFQNNDGFYQITIKFDCKTIKCKNFNINYELIKDNNICIDAIINNVIWDACNYISETLN